MPEDRIRTSDVERLLEAFGALGASDEVYAFLQDVATPKEIHDLAQRLAVARMLSAGAHYTDIQESTGASATTIARVNRSLNYGAGGYAAVLARLADPE